MKNLLTIPVEINHKVHLGLILKLCTEDQLAMFERMYPGGINKMKPSSYETAIDQVERTILRLNTDVVRLRNIEQELLASQLSSKQKDEQLTCLVNRVTALENIVDQRNETLKKFDNLTDVLTEGYGAASCINPLVDATNAIAKIRGLLSKTQERLDKLDALESCGVDNWEGYDFAMEQIDA